MDGLLADSLDACGGLDVADVRARYRPAGASRGSFRWIRSYRAAMNVIGSAANQECGRWLNNRAENSHQPFRRREGAMSKFRDVKTLQKFASVHASIHNHFNLERHIAPRNTFKEKRSAALIEWLRLGAV